MYSLEFPVVGKNLHLFLVVLLAVPLVSALAVSEIEQLLLHGLVTLEQLKVPLLPYIVLIVFVLVLLH